MIQTISFGGKGQDESVFLNYKGTCTGTPGDPCVVDSLTPIDSMETLEEHSLDNSDHYYPHIRQLDNLLWWFQAKEWKHTTHNYAVMLL